MRTLFALLAVLVASSSACSRAPAAERAVDAGPVTLVATEPESVVVASAPLLGTEPADAASTPGSFSPASPVAFADPAGATLFAFGADLYGALAAREGSFVVSPLSIAGALGVVHAGARGGTADEIARALHLSAAVGTRDLAATERDGPFAMQRSSALFVSSDVFARFSDGVRRDLFGEVVRVDFARAPRDARAHIERWTATKTADAFPDLLDRASFGPTTALVIVDALRAAATWSSPFPRDRTSPGTFERLDGARVSVPMMTSRAHRPAWHGPTHDVVAVASGPDHALVVVMPAPGAFATLERTLGAEKWREVLGRLQPRDVELTLPRFSVRSRVDLAPALRTLGIRAAFSATDADFSGVQSAPTFVENAVHGARLDVDERGVTTVAASAVVLQKAAPRPAPLALRVDRPFVFALMNTKTGTPIVVGRYLGP